MKILGRDKAMVLHASPDVFFSCQDRLKNIAVPDWRPLTIYQEALAFADVQSHPADSAIIVTDPYHQYRVKWTFAHVFSKTKIKFTYVSTQPTAALGFWWKNCVLVAYYCPEPSKLINHPVGVRRQNDPLVGTSNGSGVK